MIVILGMEKKIAEEITITILKKIEECLRNGDEEEAVKLMKEGMKVSSNKTLKNRMETLMLSLL